MEKNIEKLPTGSRILDVLLNGGYEQDIATTIYGPAGSGKTNLCILCAVNTVRLGKKVIYIDTESNFSVERLKQICSSINLNYKKIINSIVFLKPSTFEEQKNTFEKLKEMVNNNIGLIIIDTIAMLYRLEIGKNDDVYEVNRELGRQLAYLKEISAKKNIPILIVNQVYADFEDKDKVKLVGGDLLKYASKCLLELQITPSGNRRIIIRKHRSLKEEKEITFKIVEGGILGTKEGRGFKLF
ncbi:MAG: DNA repair and recombination protein RadB [Candidatus Woesearchaeota archaeon]|jgi:DNA repair protein RadB|nr:DNA repair and recombination protein RadB [Candidatus Woesearchaeota archaeon]MDP7623051.1 DNA repair and recombination protein RadB [Candidatus Woesearchaeota archaeon]HJN56731.1 DNA repair and recombination protein RadB [Candidatus Woesearchaeota archaeon]|tara:strand:+ start:16670 stop:17395 length:726 start_codon:yes stop_codon:yes gene_type:complete